MKIEKININEIIEYSGNAKEHPEWQIEQIKNSIQEFGFNDPIAIDENNTIIEGHGRYLALKELGYEEIEVIRLNHLSEEQKADYAIAHNKLTMNTEFDIEKLQYELSKLEVNDFDLSVLGFEQPELDEILTFSKTKSITKQQELDWLNIKSDFRFIAFGTIRLLKSTDKRVRAKEIKIILKKKVNLKPALEKYLKNRSKVAVSTPNVSKKEIVELIYDNFSQLRE